MTAEWEAGRGEGKRGKGRMELEGGQGELRHSGSWESFSIFSFSFSFLTKIHQKYLQATNTNAYPRKHKHLSSV